MTIANITQKPVDMQPAAMLRLWRERPLIFFKDVFDVKLDAWQEHVTDLYMNNQRVAVVANKGPGKTFLLNMLGWHFFVTNHEAKIAALSVTREHLSANLWAELLKWRSKSKLLTMSTTESATRIAMKGKEGFNFIDARGYAKSADETQQASALAGLHADNIAFLMDEAGMMPDAILNTANAALSGGDGHRKNAKLLVTANPEQPKGLIYRAYKKDPDIHMKWEVYNVTGDPDLPDHLRTPRVTREWAREQIAQYGADHPWVLVNVFGKYPTTASDMLLTEDEIDAAMKRTIDERQVRNAQYRLGVDVSRGGVDSTCLAPRRGLKAYPIEELSSEHDGPYIAGRVSLIQQRDQVERVYVDNTGGYGSSVVDSLRMNPTVDTIPVVYNSKASEKNIYYNKRTEMWVRMRDWVRNGGCLPNNPRLKVELMAPKLYFLGTVMRLEEKEQIKKRIGYSPDRADALAQTFYDTEQPSFYADFAGSAEIAASGIVTAGDYGVDINMHRQRNSNHQTFHSTLDTGMNLWGNGKS